MISKRLTPLTLAAAMALATSVAATASADRVRLVNVNGYSVIDNQHLVLNGGVSRHYLVTLRNRCNAIRWGYRLATSFPSTTTLHAPYSEYVYAEEGNYRCYIDTIEEVESLDEARALVEARSEAEADAGASESR